MPERSSYEAAIGLGLGETDALADGAVDALGGVLRAGLDGEGRADGD